MTAEEHRQLGLELAVAGDELLQIQNWLTVNHLPKNHKVINALRAARREIDKARYAMDGVLYSQPALADEAERSLGGSTTRPPRTAPPGVR